MADSVKRRSYKSEVRTEQAQATRARLLDAARESFLERGYRATTTAGVARAAGVSEASLFVTFGSKAELLVAVVVAEVRGTAEQVPQPERPEWKRMAAEPDKAKAVADFARFVSRAHSRTWRLLAITTAAAQDDPVLAAIQAKAAEGRRRDCMWFATTVARLPGATAATERAVDVMWAQTSVDMYRLLVNQRGWPAMRYERWLTTTLRRELLGEPHDRPNTGP